MREAFIAVWDGSKWCPKSNDPDNHQFDLINASWPKKPKYELLTPRFNLGYQIEYKNWDHYSRGVIIGIYANFNILKGYIVYTVKHIGHNHDVFDYKNSSDIKII